MLGKAGDVPGHKTVPVVVGFWSTVVSNNCYFLFLAVFCCYRFFLLSFSLVVFCLWPHKEQSKNTRWNSVGRDLTLTDSSARSLGEVSGSIASYLILANGHLNFTRIWWTDPIWPIFGWLLPPVISSEPTNHRPYISEADPIPPCAQAKPSPCHLCRGLKGFWPFSVRRGTKKLPFRLTRYLFWGRAYFLMSFFESGSKAPRGAWRARFPVQGWWEKLGIAFQTWDGVEKKGS